MMAAGLLFGVTAGLCVAPVWMMLSLPMRVMDCLHIQSVKMCGWALALGAAWGAQSFLPFCEVKILGAAGIFFGGMFVGMIASALTEALEVIPVLYKKLSIEKSMRKAAWALALGKMCGAFLAAIIK